MSATTGKYTAIVRWMTANGPSHVDIIYRGLTSYVEEKDSGRIILNFENYDLWLFTRHMATFQIEADVDATAVSRLT